VIGGYLTPPPPLTLTISPNKSNQSFQIAILFNVVEILEIRSLRMTLPPALRAKVVSYALGVYKVFIENFVIET
jgi:hypothetical protein